MLGWTNFLKSLPLTQPGSTTVSLSLLLIFNTRTELFAADLVKKRHKKASQRGFLQPVSRSLPALWRVHRELSAAGPLRLPAGARPDERRLLGSPLWPMAGETWKWHSQSHWELLHPPCWSDPTRSANPNCLLPKIDLSLSFFCFCLLILTKCGTEHILMSSDSFLFFCKPYNWWLDSRGWAVFYISALFSHFDSYIWIAHVYQVSDPATIDGISPIGGVTDTFKQL